MARKNELRLDEGKEQDWSDNWKNWFREARPSIRHEHQRDEGDDSRDDSKGDRGGYFLGPDDGRLRWIHSFAELGVNILSRDDGIIDDDTQNDDKAEEGHHVDATSKEGHEEKSSGKGYWHSKENPDGESGSQKEPQDNEDQESALDERVGQSGEAASKGC